MLFRSIVIRPSFSALGAPALLPLGAALSFALYLMLTRKLAQHELPERMQFYAGVFGAVAMTIALLIGAAADIAVLGVVWPSPSQWLLLAGLGVIATGGHLLVVHAFRWAPAGLLAPFTRGEVTKSTATEQNLLAAYTTTEIGRMARTRDAAISAIAETYNVMLSVILGDEGEPLALPNPVGPTILSADDLTGDFRYWAMDQGSTPMAEMVKRQNLERLTPMLLQLGVDPATVLAELVRTYDLPEEFAAAAPPPAPEALPFPGSPGPEAGGGVLDAMSPPVLPEGA